MAHGQSADIDTAVRIGQAALQACAGLEDDWDKRYYADIVCAFLSEAARQEIQAMSVEKHEYLSDFARGYVAQGRAEGRALGQAEFLRRLLTVRFGGLTAEVESRIARATADELISLGERLLTAQTPDQLLDGR